MFVEGGALPLRSKNIEAEQLHLFLSVCGSTGAFLRHRLKHSKQHSYTIILDSQKTGIL